MKDIFQLTRNMNEFAYIVMIKFKLFQLEQVFNIPKITGDKIVHPNHMITFLDEPVAEMGTQEIRLHR